MPDGIAIVRHHIERIDGVSRTWFEWADQDGDLVKVLVIEVDFSTDPEHGSFRRGVLDAILDTTKAVLTDETTMVVSHLRIIPKEAR